MEPQEAAKLLVWLPFRLLSPSYKGPKLLTLILRSHKLRPRAVLQYCPTYEVILAVLLVVPPQEAR